MHLTLLSAAVAFTLSGVHAQQLPPRFTPCIKNCLVHAIAQDLNSCSMPDVQCLCANKKIQQDVFSCLQQQCTTQEVSAVQAFVAAECAPAASSTSTHSEAPSSSSSPSTRTGSSSEAYTSGKTSASFSATAAPSSSPHLSSTTTALATSLANSTSIISTTSTTPVALSSSAASSDAPSSTPSAAPARTNAATRVDRDAIGIPVYAVLGAVLGGAAAVW
ncbi:hypothetical protein V8D89_001391 [Ganoderma adspersum]